MSYCVPLWAQVRSALQVRHRPKSPLVHRPADDAAKAAEAKPTDPASIKVERTASGAKLFRITEGLVVEGQMQKPAAFYVLRRAAIPYDFAELGKSFLPKIGAAVKAPPF